MCLVKPFVTCKHTKPVYHYAYSIEETNAPEFLANIEKNGFWVIELCKKDNMNIIITIIHI